VKHLLHCSFGDIALIFEHKDFFVINKPSGLACHGPDSENLAALLREAQLSNKLCHRLDKDSSGLLIIAKHQQAANHFRVLFEQDAINKFYLALSHRKGKKKQGSIKGFMEKARNGKWKLSNPCNNDQDRLNTSPAISHFFSFGSQHKDNSERIFIIKIIGGKTHQIRVAMKANSSPILGDKLYGGHMAERLMLHACALQFDYQGEAIRLYSPAIFVDQLGLQQHPQILKTETLTWPK
jgi:tRNA pseudouridine32 synthase/23S rRNA pseudouridine746 synthase